MPASSTPKQPSAALIERRCGEFINLFVLAEIADIHGGKPADLLLRCGPDPDIVSFDVAINPPPPIKGSKRLKKHITVNKQVKVALRGLFTSLLDATCRGAAALPSASSDDLLAWLAECKNSNVAFIARTGSVFQQRRSARATQVLGRSTIFEQLAIKSLAASGTTMSGLASSVCVHAFMNFMRGIAMVIGSAAVERKVTLNFNEFAAAVRVIGVCCGMDNAPDVAAYLRLGLCAKPVTPVISAPAPVAPAPVAPAPATPAPVAPAPITPAPVAPVPITPAPVAPAPIAPAHVAPAPVTTISDQRSTYADLLE